MSDFLVIHELVLSGSHTTFLNIWKN